LIKRDQDLNDHRLRLIDKENHVYQFVG